MPRPTTIAALCRCILVLIFVPTSTISRAHAQASSAADAKPVPRFNPSDYMPVCSTEKVNGNCFVNIDRRNPITMPPYQMKRGSHITVYVFHAFPFENLTLDPGTANAYQSTDQASGLVSAVIPFGKGASFGTVDSDMKLNLAESYQLTGLANLFAPEIQKQHPDNPNVILAKSILSDLTDLNKKLDQALKPISTYIDESRAIYAQVREIESPVPRPLKDANWSDGRRLIPEVPEGTPDPWQHYDDWRAFIRKELMTQGKQTTSVLDRLPGVCQKSGDATPPAGLWLPSARSCGTPPAASPIESSTPLKIPADYQAEYQKMTAELAQLAQDQPDPQTFANIQELKTKLDQRQARVIDSLALAKNLLPALITKVTTDMQSVYQNVSFAADKVIPPMSVGVISDPAFSPPLTPDEKKVLATYKALAPSNPYTLNAQNEIANSLLGLPSASQKQSVITITSVFAEPRFEVSSGAFFSFLRNRTFSNLTEVSVVNGTPTTQDVKIDSTLTTRPLVIPFAAANYKIGSDFTWWGGRRGAFYATAGVALNPYNQLVEYPLGFSLSWRYLMFSPFYHLGHGVHLTQGEQVGQIWCQYGNGATSTSTPPVCSGSPPAPSTKTFWTGQFAFGISVRIPTTYTSANH